jgi:hypothetical protein
VPNSIVVSRGCPHVCDFCYKEAFFEGGRSFYTQTVDAALAEIERLPGRHLYFLDDHLFGDKRFATALFDGMRGMGRLWQAAGTVNAVLSSGLLEKAVAAGLRSLFVGFETLNPTNLVEQHKYQNLRRDYAQATDRLHDLGVMINGSFVYGMDGDDESVFERTVDWAIERGIETATFHVLTPYPGTALHSRMVAQGRITTENWDLYDTRHAVFRPALMSADALERGYQRAYRHFYRWRSIVRGAAAHDSVLAGLRHAAYAAGWKKFEPMWDLVIRAKRAGMMLPVLETILSEFGTRAAQKARFSASSGRDRRSRTWRRTSVLRFTIWRVVGCRLSPWHGCSPWPSPCSDSCSRRRRACIARRFRSRAAIRCHTPSPSRAATTVRPLGRSFSRCTPAARAFRTTAPPSSNRSSAVDSTACTRSSSRRTARRRPGPIRLRIRR